jgi:hypothetical protein
VDEIRDLARALNRVTMVGQAAIASASAIAHGRKLAEEARSLPSEFFAGAANGTSVSKAIANAVMALERDAPQYGVATAGSAQRVNPTAWERTRNLITRIYVEGSVIYAARDVKPFKSMVADIGTAIVAYGDKLAKAGVAAPGVLLGDVAKALGKNTGELAKGVGEGAGAAVAGARSGIFSILWKGAPLLIIAGVVVFFVIPQGRKAVLGV